MSHDRRHHAVLSIPRLKVGAVDAGAVDEGVNHQRRELLDVLGNECQCRGGVDASGLDIASDAVVGPRRLQEVAQGDQLDASTVGSAPCSARRGGGRRAVEVAKGCGKAGCQG